MDHVDIVVVGAGIAGLTAARALSASGLEVLVLEARDRVGGRTFGHRLRSGFTVEMGGAYVGPKQTAILDLIDELDLQTYPTYESGDSLTLLNGVMTSYASEDGTFGLTHSSLAEIGRLQGMLEDLAETVSPAAPWAIPRAAEFDRHTFDAWLAANTDDEVASKFYRAVVTALFTAGAWEISLLHFLFYVRSNRGLDNLVSTTGGNQESRIIGGSQRICERLAADLDKGVVRLNAPAHTVTQHDAGVTVVYDGGQASGQRVIIALPPTLAGRLRYSPPLPASRDILMQQVPMGSVIKTQAAYLTPFWRDEGLSGFVVSLDEKSAFTFTMDSSPPDGACGVLTAFSVGADARELGTMPAGQRRKQVLDTLVEFFGPGAAQPEEYVEMDWSGEEYTRGCYGGHLGAGVWTQYGAALAEPVGRIHWAGSETADLSSGYMDGAVRSGHRAAAEVLAALPMAAAL